MSRKNLEGNYWGESQRLTIRLTRADVRTLDELAKAGQADRSEVLRRALRGAGEAARRRAREEQLASLSTLTVAELRVLAAEHRIPGRSKMTKARLEQALRNSLIREA